MSRTTYYPQWYRCEASDGTGFYCGKEQQHYVWSNEVEKAKHKCTLCGKPLTIANAIDREAVEAPLVRTPTSNSRIQASRKKRNLDHWKKNDYPNLAKGSDEQKHFAKKHKLKT